MIAFIRDISPNIGQCELVYLERAPIDWERARLQHRDYIAALEALGCQLEWLPPLPEHADGVFVEDTAVLLPEVALITSPGAASRRGEVATVAEALSAYLPVRQIGAPATLEGGDVLHIGRTLYVGASGRTNSAGIAELGEILGPFGYKVRAVALQGCLHLKSACTFLPPNILVVNPAWIDPSEFEEALKVVSVDEGEAYAANTLTVGGVTLVSAAFPRTQERLNAAGVITQALDVSELQKAESALTCLSLLLEPSATSNSGQ